MLLLKLIFFIPAMYYAVKCLFYGILNFAGFLFFTTLMGLILVCV